MFHVKQFEKDFKNSKQDIEKYINKTMKGMMQTIAKAGKPAVTNWYIAKKNRRKSNNTLPPFSREYATTLFVIYLAWLFSTAVRPIWDMRYTKLLNFVYGGNWPTNSSTA